MLYLSRSVTRQAHVEFMPHMSERLPGFFRQAFQPVAAIPLSGFQQRLIEAIALPGDGMLATHWNRMSAGPIR